LSQPRKFHMTVYSPIDRAGRDNPFREGVKGDRGTPVGGGVPGGAPRAGVEGSRVEESCGVEEAARMDHKQKDQPEGNQHDEAEQDGGLPYRDDAQNIKKCRRPDDDQADGDLVVRHFGKEESGIAHKKDGIDGQVEEGVEPGPPAFEKSPADPEGMFDPLIVAAGYGHEAV